MQIIMNTDNKYRYRHLAHVVIEAKTPLIFGTGEKDIISDNMIAKDVNGLPYIPGTTIAGTLRHTVGEQKAKSFFGNRDRIEGKESEGKGSEIIFSEARILGPSPAGNGMEPGRITAIEGFQHIDWSDSFYRHFKELPVRQHVRISHKGAVDGSSKFDGQVIFKGTRFCFNIELVSDSQKDDLLKTVLDALNDDSYAIGAGSRSGFGKIEVVSCLKTTFDLESKEISDGGLDRYLDTSSSLNCNLSGWESYTPGKNQSCIRYEITLTPEDFFLFGSGKSDSEADMTPAKEDFIVWDGGIPTFMESQIFIPGSSLKGALAHRTAFHYNKMNGIYADQYAYLDDYTGKNNRAVSEIFGSEGVDGTGKVRGKALFSDIFEITRHTEKIVNHVAIDSFTGGAVDGALFSEKVTSISRENPLKTEILMDKDISEESIAAFESALKDLCSGMLALGGGSNRGNGFFTGKIRKYDGNEVSAL